MQALFLKILNMSLSASIVIAAIIIASLALRRAPKKWSFLLWLAAAFRLCCPVSTASVFSLFRISTVKPVSDDAVGSVQIRHSQREDFPRLPHLRGGAVFRGQCGPGGLPGL